MASQGRPSVRIAVDDANKDKDHERHEDRPDVEDYRYGGKVSGLDKERVAGSRQEDISELTTCGKKRNNLNVPHNHVSKSTSTMENTCYGRRSCEYGTVRPAD